MSNEILSFELLFDPLCGWCYGAHPIVREVATQTGKPLRLTPTGLFAGANGRDMDAGFAAYAWQNDQRIMQMTGQQFSAAYRSDVLQAGGRFDSWLLTLAFHILSSTRPDAALEVLEVLEALQRARYVAGRDVSGIDVLADVAESLGMPRSDFLAAMQDDANAQAARARVQAGQQAQRAAGVRGVPALLAHTTAGTRLIPSLYDPASLAAIGVDI